MSDVSIMPLTPLEKLELRLRKLKPSSVSTVMLVIDKAGHVVGFTVLDEKHLEVMAET